MFNLRFLHLTGTCNRSRRIIQIGILPKLKTDIYVDFLLSFYPTTLYEFHKSEVSRKVVDLSWKPLNYSGFYQLFVIYALLVILILTVQLIELSIALFTICNTIDEESFQD